MDKYSALIPCGGDGTVFEVINGMLEREDGKKLPIGVIPNGSGNGIASGVGIRDTDMALEAIRNRQALKGDLFRVISDTENNDEIPLGGQSFKTRRVYSALCLYFGGLTKMMAEATPLKPYLGSYAYDVMLLKDWATFMRFVPFDVTIDDKVVTTPGSDDVKTVVVMFWMHNKLVGKAYNFPAVLNDGLMEACFFVNPNLIKANSTGIGQTALREKQGICESYTGNCKWYRGKKAVVRCKDPDPARRDISVDGETSTPYKEFVTVECLKGEIEYIFNAE